MNELLQLSIITSLQICFIHILFWDGMFLAWIRRYIESKLVMLILREEECEPMENLWEGISLCILIWFIQFMMKPLFSCLICMTSIWGILFWYFEWNQSINIITYLFTVGGINVLLTGLISRAEDVNGEQFVKQTDSE